MLPVDPPELEGKLGAYGDGGRSLPGWEALSEHDTDQGIVVVDVRVVIVARRENDAVLVLGREVVAFQYVAWRSASRVKLSTGIDHERCAVPCRRLRWRAPRREDSRARRCLAGCPCSQLDLA